ncbi:hypothetical protein BBJ29_006985 [Phytophthora kernoviae]|uniref:Uncharacterized protein n=1 Tax=Phytophthora kernoviae TaxID=325452 RepID=A0A3F2RYJ6_9STRA|nr:hypothetical protein BBJ29_006985 [Phytophthora kernoviae]RLN65873.1 hypothetical protein BBP00_00002608 [Phytophthora kernoviae]
MTKRLRATTFRGRWSLPFDVLWIWTSVSGSDKSRTLHGVDGLDALRSPRDNEALSLIDVLSSQLQNREIPQYLDEFEVVIPDAEVVVGAVPIEEVQQREQQVEEARLRQAELESSLYRQRELHLAKQETLARERLLQEAKRRHAELVMKDRQAAEATQLRARRIGHVFQKAETHLKDALKKQEARVEQVYGTLTPSRVPQSRKRYRVEWARIPLTIRVRAKMLCALKDKLPSGQYVMVATLYDRLGGHALHWTNWDPEVAPRESSANDTSSTRTHVGRPNFTRPFHHRGRFYNTEVAVNQDLFVEEKARTIHAVSVAVAMALEAMAHEFQFDKKLARLSMQRDRVQLRKADQHEDSDPLLANQPSSRQLSSDGLDIPEQFDNIDGIEEQEDGDDDDNTPDDKNRQIDVENYTYSVNAAASMETARHQRFHAQRKMHYLRHELLVDLGFSNWHTLEFWRLTAMLLFACWIRVYVHYLTQWLFMRGNRVAVYDFQPRWTTCIVKYTWQTVATRTELGLLAVGVLGNIMMFAFLSGAAAVGQRFVGDLPAFGSNFVVCAGIATVLDPFLVLIVDVLSHHYGCAQLSECVVSLTASGCSCVVGDWFKLYVRFQAQEGSGIIGAFIVLILYVALTCLSLLGLYVYLLYIHMNGRMLDVYRRVHGREDSFFMPHDAEVSLQELEAICAQATRWKGPRGTQRKVFVHEYALTDPLDLLFRETNAHVAVYNVELDGTRELHRHFLKMPDGAVLELFGELEANTDGNWKSDAPQGAASLALLYNILQDVQRDDKTTSITTGGLFDDL